MKNSKNSINQKFKLFRILLIITGLIFLCGILVLCFCRMDDTVSAIGKLKGITDYDLRAMVTGTINERLKEEGDTVKKGEVIMTLDMTPLLDQISILKSDIAELEAQLVIQKNKNEILKNNPRPKEFTHAETEVEAKRKQFEYTQRNLAIYKSLYEKQALSRIEYEKMELANSEAEAALKKAESDTARVNKGMEANILEQSENEIKLTEIKLENKKKQLAASEKHISDYKISAPEDGIVTDMPYPPGHFAQKGDQISKMSSIKQKKYLAYVSERHVYKIRPGQPARITSAQYNYINFGYFHGTVKQVYELPVKQGDTNYYPVEVLVTNEPYDLKLGSTAELIITTGRERIIVCLLGLNN